MPFDISITEDAERQLQSFTARERRMVEDAVWARLSQAPMKPTRAIKQLRPNPFAQFELRVGALRVLYNVEGNDVVLLLVGRKVGNTLVVEGEEFHGHQDNPPQQPDSGPAGDAP
jgi:mRNA-degrading endonuclease RelE of RelBE toxin-antitoxin system